MIVFAHATVQLQQPMKYLHQCQSINLIVHPPFAMIRLCDITYTIKYDKRFSCFSCFSYFPFDMRWHLLNIHLTSIIWSFDRKVNSVLQQRQFVFFLLSFSYAKSSIHFQFLFLSFSIALIDFLMQWKSKSNRIEKYRHFTSLFS